MSLSQSQIKLYKEIICSSYVFLPLSESISSFFSAELLIRGDELLIS